MPQTLLAAIKVSACGLAQLIFYRLRLISAIFSLPCAAINLLITVNSLCILTKSHCRLPFPRPPSKSFNTSSISFRSSHYVLRIIYHSYSLTPITCYISLLISYSYLCIVFGKYNVLVHGFNYIILMVRTKQRHQGLRILVASMQRINSTSIMKNSSQKLALHLWLW